MGEFDYDSDYYYGEVITGGGAPDYAVTTDAGANYVMVDETNYVVTQV